MTLVQPSPELQILIRQEVNEDVNTRDIALQAIKEWLAKQPHLPNTWDDSCIMTFLRGCNFSMEKTKRKLDLYFTMRTAAPEFFANRDINKPELQDIMRFGIIAPLPRLTPDGRRVIVLRGIDKNANPSLEDCVKLFLMIGDIRLAEEHAGVAGDVYILDGGIVTATHCAKLTPSLIKKFLVCSEQAYPVQHKGIHIVNTHSVIDLIYSICKPLLKAETINKIHFHTNGLESLYKFVPKDVLPEEYGGTAGKLQDFYDEWKNKLQEYTPWFKGQENLKADESKRPGKPTNYCDLFGVDGSFKKLNID